MEGTRERLGRLGPDQLSDAELLAVVLGTGVRGEPVLLFATRILHELGGLRGLAARELGALLGVPGLGLGKACRIRAALELGERVVSRPLDRRKPIMSSRDVVESLAPRLGTAACERVFAIPVDARNRPLAEIVVAIGGPSSCPVAPADLFRRVLREAASGVIVAHNHPSGDATPSTEDLVFTSRLQQAGELLGLPLLDHVIIAQEAHFSFCEAGLLGGRTAA